MRMGKGTNDILACWAIGAESQIPQIWAMFSDIEYVLFKVFVTISFYLRSIQISVS